MKLLNTLVATSAIVAGITAISIPAYAAEYYNCSNPTGCEMVESKNPRNTATQTQYPVVMAHGLGGWTTLFGVLEYYNGIPEALMKGGTDVYTTKTSSVNSTDVRGEQLLQQVQTITALSGKDKVNLFGHSHGGIDVRYVAGVAPEYVASVTAVAAPNQGAALADLLVDTFEEQRVEEGLPIGEFSNSARALIAFFNFVGEFMDVGSGISIEDIQEQDSYATVSTLNFDYMADDFNVKFPAGVPSEYCGQPPANNVVDGISYYSFSGEGTFYNPFDPFDYAMSLTALAFEDDPNDGMISSCSSRLGYVIRDDYKMNHLDIVNQLLGLVAWGQADPISVYRTQVNRLKNNNF